MAKTPTQKAKETAWKWFSLYIRTRDPYCVTCLVEEKKRQSENAGHFWHNVLDFDEVNVNGQCIHCNKYNSGKLAQYSIYLINKHGIKEFKALEKRKYKALAGEKRSEQEYREIADTYRNKCKELQQNLPGGIYDL